MFAYGVAIAWLMAACILVTSSPGFAANSFDVDASGRDSIVFLKGFPGWSLWGWKLDRAGAVVEDKQGGSSGDPGYDPMRPIWCCATTMGDYNGDGYADLVDQYAPWGGAAALRSRITTMQVLRFVNSVELYNDPGVLISGRFVATGRDSIFTRVYGANRCMFGDTTGSISVACPTAPYIPVGAADIDGDGFDDIFFRNPTTGDNWVWYIRDGAIVGEQSWPSVDPAWAPAAVSTDRVGNSADLIWQHTSGFLWRQCIRNKAIACDAPLAALTAEWTVASSGDYDGDGRRDLLMRRASDGQMWVLFLDATGVRLMVPLPIPIQSGWVPLPAK